jgi:hypothetical protein
MKFVGVGLDANEEEVTFEEKSIEWKTELARMDIFLLELFPICLH